MKTSKFIFAFIAAMFMMCNAKTFAQGITYKVQGTVGTSKIHATLIEGEDSKIEGHYYYDKVRAQGDTATIRLSGSLGESMWPSQEAVIFEYDGKGNKIGRFEVYITLVKSGYEDTGYFNISGTYINLQNGKTYDVDWNGK